MPCPRRVAAAAAVSVDEPVDSMDDVGGQGGIAAVDPMGSSSVMEDSCALEIDAAAAGRREDEQVTHALVICSS